MAAPPYDVVNRVEARELAVGNPESFLHIGRSDADPPDSVDPYDPRIYEGARATLDRFIKDGILRRDPAPSLRVKGSDLADELVAVLARQTDVADEDVRRRSLHGCCN